MTLFSDRIDPTYIFRSTFTRMSTKQSSSGSSKQASSSSRKTDQTNPSSVQSTASRRWQAERDTYLASEIENVRINSPRLGPTTRSMTGALKRGRPGSEPVQELELDRPARGSPKKRRAAASDPTVGSPWDATVRTKLDVDDLDLDNSYAGVFTPTPRREPPRPPRQQRWRHDGDQPLIDIKRLPEGWNTREPDLDPKYVSFLYFWDRSHFANTEQ